MALTDDQIERYARHIRLANVGLGGQAKLLAAKVLVIGAGGLGSPLIQYLTAAGVGTVGIVDDDIVDISNNLGVSISDVKKTIKILKKHKLIK